MKQLSDLNVVFLETLHGNGRISYLSDICKWHSGWKICFVTGSVAPLISRFLKALALTLYEKGSTVTLIAASGNPRFLDGIIIEDEGVVYWGGGRVHLKGAYPVICESLIDLSAAHARGLLKHSPEIFSQMSAAENYRLLTSKYIKTAGEFLKDNMKLAANCIDTAAVERYAGKLLTHISAKKNPRISGCFLSTLSGEGNVYHCDTIKKMCDKIHSVEDEHGAVSKTIMETVKNEAIRKGLNIIVCCCPIQGEDKIDHIILPDERTAFVTSNKYLKRIEGSKVIRARRFTNSEKMREYAQRLAFCRRTARELLIAASENSAQANESAMKAYSCYLKNAKCEIIDDIVGKIVTKF